MRKEATRTTVLRRLGVRPLLVVVGLLSAPFAFAVDIDRGVASQRQRVDGWGSSLAWSGNGVGSWTDAQARTDILRVVFDQQNGLGLNYARYNVGGGQNRLYSGNMRPGALVQGWAPNAPSDVQDTSTWEWDWNADQTQRRVLDEALEFGVTRADAISYSAPYWMTYSQDSAGNVDGAPNLPPEHYDELAHYQAEVIGHFYNNLGVQFQAFSPLNEPDVNWWVAGGRQEGMVVPDGQPQREILREVGEAFAARGLPIGLSATEETNTPKAINSWQQLDATAKGYVTHLHTHTYGNDQTASLNQLRNLAAADGKKLYMSEYGNNSTTGLLGGVALANRITLDVNELGANAWAYWQVIEPGTLTTVSPQSAWGLVWTGYDQTDSGFEIRKQYHVMRQFTHGIRPGSTILDTTDADTVAAYDPVADATALVVSNLGNTSVAKSFTLTDGSATFVRKIRTTNSEDFAAKGRQAAGDSFALDTPGQSITTLLLHHKPNLVQNPFLDAASGGQTLAGGWQASGSASFATEAGPGDDTTLGAAVIDTDPASGAGAVWQEGIGTIETDLTGEAFQLSLDVQLQADTSQVYAAETTIALEFYGADGETLTHDGVGDFATELIRVTEDPEWRTFRTPTIVAPAGTRFVRPVVRVDGAEAASTAEVRVDNFYLQGIRHVPRGRHWIGAASGAASSEANWDSDASRAEHNSWYFGPEIDQAVTVAVGSDDVVSHITFDSDVLYRLAGAGPLKLAADSDGVTGIDVRGGTHTIQVPVELEADAVFQALDGATLSVSGPVDAAGFALRVQGAGEINLTGALSLDGGALEVFAKEESALTLGPLATLNGSLRVLLEPGSQIAIGDAFELVSYSGAVTQFDAIELPELAPGMAWDVAYGADSLMASIVAFMLEGDFNDDGKVDAADYSLWRDNVGAPAGTLPNDPNGTPIGPDQYQTWLANYGATASSAVAIPEPGASLSAAVAVIALGIGAQREHRKADR